MEPKLQGQKYLDHWRKRMAQGPDQVSFNGRDADRQGEVIWTHIEPVLRLIGEIRRPEAVLDFGCGYGRMLRRIHRLWPGVELFGVDLCHEALEHIARDKNWFDCGKPQLSEAIHGDRSVDLVLSCLVLQHITDDAVLQHVADNLFRSLRAGGRMVLIENIACPGAAHVRDMGAEDYMQLWPQMQWEDHWIVVLGGQEHALMWGAKE